jgi:mannose-6-phosphate isomerase-like protein (cupin superfamily)
MGFSTIAKKGLAKCLIDNGVNPDSLQMHISEIAPGTRAHPPHTHEGVEAFYVLEGKGTVEVEGERFALGHNEAILLDTTKLHGLVNTGTTPMRYMVIIAQP